MLIFLLKAEQLALFDSIVPVRAHTDKRGRIVGAHTSHRKKRVHDHIDDRHRRLHALGASGDLKEASALSKEMSHYMDWSDVDLSDADRKAVQARKPVSAHAMIQSAKDYRERFDEHDAPHSFYDEDHIVEALSRRGSA